MSELKYKYIPKKNPSLPSILEIKGSVPIGQNLRLHRRWIFIENRTTCEKHSEDYEGQTETRNG